MDKAETIMESQPDSAFELLKSIDRSELNSKSEKARYALLMSMALDKNYIDTTTFDVLQPAIDYYLKKGTPDEKLRTYYYQGRIYQNMGDRDNALSSFVKSLDRVHDITDSLTMAHILMAQGCIYYDFYDFVNYSKSCHRAADIYRELSLEDNEFDSRLNALNGAILSDDKSMAKNLINDLNKFKALTEEQTQILDGYRLSYLLKFGSKSEIQELLNTHGQRFTQDINAILNLALAYNKIGHSTAAKQILDSLHKSEFGYDTLKYESILVQVLEDLGIYKEALVTHREFTKKMDLIDAAKFDYKLHSIDEKYRLELETKNDLSRKSRLIGICIAGIIVLILCVVVLVLLIHNNKTKRTLAIQVAEANELENSKLRIEKDFALQAARAKELENANLMSEKELALQEAKAKELISKKLKVEKDLAVQEAKSKVLENEKLKIEKALALQRAKTAELERKDLEAEKDKLALENKNLQLERDNRELEAENLAHRLKTLEDESDTLKKLLVSQEDIPIEVRDAVRIRVEMLNAHLARIITSNEKLGQPYDIWIEELTNNINDFMNSTRLAFHASHPGFIQYFIDHGLTCDEINYLCLYAIGLHGREVGDFIKKRSHVNMSSAIRKKLGLDHHDTNIGIYVRKLLKTF